MMQASRDADHDLALVVVSMMGTNSGISKEPGNL